MYPLRSLVLVLVGALSLSVAGPTRAASLALTPSFQSGSVGDTFGVDLGVSGLASAGAPSLGAFDVRLDYDDAVLALTAVDFGVSLGDESLFEVLNTQLASPGRVELAASSLLLPFELELVQGDAFALAHFEFTGLAVGESALQLSNVILGDGDGLPLGLDSAAGARIRIDPPAPAPIPEPGAGLAFLGGLTPLAGWLREGALET